MKCKYYGIFCYQPFDTEILYANGKYIPEVTYESRHKATNRRAEFGGGAVLSQGGGSGETTQPGQCGQP